MGIYRECAVCGIVIEKPFWVCQSCEDEYGLSGVDFADWPDWMKALRYEEERYEYHTATVDGLTEFDVLESDIEHIVVPFAKHRARPLRDTDLLRYAPYDDEAMNQEYRRANGISERDL